jgi:hypothetical protein
MRRPALTLAFLLLALIPAGDASAQLYAGQYVGEDEHPKLSSALVGLARERRAHGAAAARARAADTGLDIATGGVLVQVTANDVEEATAAIGTAGGVVGERFGPNLDTRVPATALHRLTAAPTVDRVARPHLMDLFAVAGEGVAASGADAWHAGGLNGSGAKVAIIDGGSPAWRARRRTETCPRTLSPATSAVEASTPPRTTAQGSPRSSTRWRPAPSST